MSPCSYKFLNTTLPNGIYLWWVLFVTPENTFDEKASLLKMSISHWFSFQGWFRPLFICLVHFWYCRLLHLKKKHFEINCQCIKSLFMSWWEASVYMINRKSKFNKHIPNNLIVIKGVVIQASNWLSSSGCWLCLLWAMRPFDNVISQNYGENQIK